MTDKPLRILWQSNAPHCPTGYGVQANQILPRMMKHDKVDDVAIFAYWGVQGGIAKWPIGNGNKRVTVYPAMYDLWGNDVINKHVNAFDANLVITLMDIWVLRPDYGDGFTWCPYMPVDTLTLPEAFLPRLKNAYLPLTYSRHAEALLNEQGIENVYVPHGVNTKVFRPKRNQKAAKRMLGFEDDCYLVGMVAANKSNPPRKGFPEAFEAFKALHDAHPEARMYVHTTSTPHMGGPDLEAMARHYGLSGLVRFTQDYYAFLGLDDSTLAELYNAFDVLLLPTMGEGFGIPIIEAQACGTPVIVTDATACPELVGVGWKVPWDHKVWVPTGSWQVYANAAATTEALREAYQSGKTAAMQKQAAEFAHDYDWDVVWNNHWSPLLARLGDELTPRKYQLIAEEAEDGQRAAREVPALTGP